MEKFIYFLGPKTSYTDFAKEQLIKQFELEDYVEKPMRTITALVSEINNWKNKNNLAVLPIENSIEGIVKETIDNLSKIKDENIKIIGETVVSIEHCLITYSKDFSGIKTIKSHPQAISQCYNYIYTKFQDNINLESESSTANAVKKLSYQDKSIAVIGNKFSAQYYNKPILDININDENFNQTRFILIGLPEQKTITENDKTSITFSTANKPGALCDILSIFKENNINMTYISSRPSRKSLGEYSFYIDFDGNIYDSKISNAISKVLQNVKTFRHLGSYPKFDNKYSLK
ncbi:MAG: prephenate dehydratase [Candidatus Gastranaerophilaceae bacterium]